MKHQELDHAPLVEAWLKEPIWLPEIDTDRTAQLVHLTPQQHGWLRPLISGRSHTMFSAMKLAAAGVILAVFGGFLVSTGMLAPQDSGQAPAVMTAAPSASPGPSDPTPEASPTGEAGPMPETAVPADALVMGPSSGQAVAGWTELARMSTDGDDGNQYGEMRRLQAIGDRLVVIGSINGPNEGPIHDVVYHSVDGVSWIPAAVPGDDPKIADLAATGDGLVAAGSDRVDGARVARIWTSPDGIEWTEVAAPSDLKRIDQIVSAEAPLAVLGGRELWATDDGTEWAFMTKLVNMPVLRGPGGFLAWQFSDVATLLHSTDPKAGWTEVNLPGRLSQGGAGVVADTQIFALDDQWVLLPHVLNYPDSIFTSPDGLEWTEAPRPPGIIAGAVRWMADIDDEVQAFGAVDGDDGDEAGIWTFVPGEPVAEAETMAGSDEFFDAPVAFDDGYAATGLKMGRDWRLTTWERTTEAGG